MKKRILYLFLLIFIVNYLLACSRVTGKLNNNNYLFRDSKEIPISIAPDRGNLKGSKIFRVAQRLLGLPYRYGGNDLSGFDCSGLVQYSHLKAGFRVPRTSAAQYRASRNVAHADLKQGDVVFFRLNRNKILHVGIYAGRGWFIHAPSAGKKIMYSNLGEPYWRTRVVKVGRFY